MKTEYHVLGVAHDAEIFAHAGEIIRCGGLVAFPTETVYGLGGNAYDTDASKKIFAAKGRPSDNPLIVHVTSPDDAEKFAYVNDVYYSIARRFMPGAITVILPKRDCMPDTTTGGLDSVAVRCPSNVYARALIDAAGVPIAAPSANKSGAPSPTTAAHVLADMDGKIDMILDGGACDIGVESTVISLDGTSAVILRPGAVTREMLLEVCDSVTVSDAVTNPALAGDKPQSPGMKYKHYAPIADVVLVDTGRGEFIDFVNSHSDGKVAVICAEEDARLIYAPVKLIYGAVGDEDEYLKHLFYLLRRADEEKADKVWVQLPSTSGKSLALYNRLIRSAACRIIKP